MRHSESWSKYEAPEYAFSADVNRLPKQERSSVSESRLEQKYQCWNDCLPQGCPVHTAILQYQSVSNSLHFSDGKGSEIYMQTPELEVFLSMLSTLSESRTEIESVLKKTKEQE